MMKMDNNHWLLILFGSAEFSPKYGIRRAVLGRAVGQRGERGGDAATQRAERPGAVLVARTATRQRTWSDPGLAHLLAQLHDTERARLTNTLEHDPVHDVSLLENAAPHGPLNDLIKRKIWLRSPRSSLEKGGD